MASAWQESTDVSAPGARRKREVSGDAERDYVLGTHADEIARLGLQHDAWRETVHDCWRRAGLSAGARVIDVGAGPGYAAFDLAQIVGPSGTVAAVERSARFVEFGRAAGRSRGLLNLSFHERDLMLDALPYGPFDMAWCRWVASFVDSPQTLVEKIAHVVRPGGTAVFHEYADFASWRFSPALPGVQRYIEGVMANWRTAGGEPDIAMGLLPVLRQNGFVVREAVPRAFCVRPGDRFWTWLAAFLRVNSQRLIATGSCDAQWAESVMAEFRAAETNPDTFMLTPMVMEIIADRVEE